MRRLSLVLALVSATAAAQSTVSLGPCLIDGTGCGIRTPAGVTLTSGRVPYATTGGALTDDSGLTYDAATDTLSAGALTANTLSATTLRANASPTITISGGTGNGVSPIVLNATAHGLVTGDRISISGVTGNTNCNGYFKVTRLTADTFSIQNYSTGAELTGNGVFGGAPVATTGIVQAGRVMVGDGDRYQPGLSFAADPDTGFYLAGANQIGFALAGGSYGSLSATRLNVNVAEGYSVNGDVFWSRSAAAVWQAGGANSASPVAQTLQAQGSRGGTDVDVAGANLTIQSGSGTGAATGSSLVFKTATPTTSGSSAQSMDTRMSLSSATFVLYNGTTPRLEVSSNTAQAKMGSNYRLAWSSTSDATATGDTFIGRGAAATLQLGAADAAAPVAQTLQVQGSRGGTDTDVAGANLVIRPGAGTGSAAGSTVTIQTPAVGSTGTTAQTQTSRLVASAKGINIPGLAEYTDNAAALAGGLVAGDLYRTSTGVLMVTY